MILKRAEDHSAWSNEQWMELAGTFEKKHLNFQELACLQEIIKSDPFHWNARYRELSTLHWIRHEGRLRSVFDNFFKDLYAQKDSTGEEDTRAFNQQALCMYLFYVYSMPEINDTELLAHYRSYAEQKVPIWTETLRKNPSVLRIGYLGREFYNNSSMQILLPMLKNHTSRVEIHIYDDSWSTKPEHLINLVKDRLHWHDITKTTNSELITKIKADKIDVLVDVAGPTFLMRNDVFYQRAAPVQVGGLGFLFSSGKPLDYCLSDRTLTPPEVAEHYPETVKYLPTIFQWNPFMDHPLEQPKHKGIVLGSANTLNKINSQVIAAWSELLHRLPEATLFLKTSRFNDPFTRQMYTELFAHHGIMPERLRLEGALSQFPHLPYFYNQIDISLDPFPYQGAITHCDALFMGVPVVSLRKKEWRGRALGATLLDHVGHSEWVAQDLESYYAKVIALARDKAYRQKLKLALRDELKKSILCQNKQFALSIEDAYFEMYNEMYT